MIGFLIRLVLVLLAAVALGWIVPIATAEVPEDWLARENAQLQLAYSGSDEVSSLMAVAMKAAEGAGEIPFAERIPHRVLIGVALAIAVTTIRVEITLRVAPIMILITFVATVCGLYVRERTKLSRSPEKHFSVTVGYLSKLVLGAGGLVLVLFGLTPLPLPYWSVYAATGAGGFGAFGYAASLVDKL